MHVSFNVQKNFSYEVQKVLMCPIFATRLSSPKRSVATEVELAQQVICKRYSLFSLLPNFRYPYISDRILANLPFTDFFDQNYVSCLSEKAEEDAIDVTHDKMRPGIIRFPVFSESKQPLGKIVTMNTAALQDFRQQV